MILNINKEKGWTSFDVVAKVKGILSKKSITTGGKKVKVGHAGTLDPLAEGVLIVLTDADTRKQDALMQTDKEYVCEIAFGAESPTYELEGPVSFSELPVDFSLKAQLPPFIKRYIGQVQQTVPAYSAASVNGKRLYDLARAGKADLASLPKKLINIDSIEVLDFGTATLNDHVLPIAKLRVVCGKGTYIRSLAHDLGQDIGVGALLLSLVRTRVGIYTLENSQKISDLES